VAESDVDDEFVEAAAGHCSRKQVEKEQGSLANAKVNARQPRY